MNVYIVATSSPKDYLVHSVHRSQTSAARAAARLKHASDDDELVLVIIERELED